MALSIGISTASFYPNYLEDALIFLEKHAIKHTEIFFNTPSELSERYISFLKEQIASSGIQVDAIHPFTSELENLLFFSDYPRRVKDGIAYYRRYFKIARDLHCRYFVFHGQNQVNPYPYQKGFSVVNEIAKIAQEYGVFLLQENVARCCSAHVEYIRAMRSFLGEKIGFVLDIKQAVRSGLPWEEVLDAMGAQLRHIHISDHTEGSDCLLPGKGNLNFPLLMRKLKAYEFNGSMLIELYRSSYQKKEDVINSYRYLQKMCENF